MRKPRALIKLLCLLCAIAAVADASARQLELRAKAVRTGAATLSGVHVTLDWSDAEASGRLRLQADALEVPVLAWRAQRVDWQCPLERTGAEGWRCAGNVRLAGGKAMALMLALDAGGTRAEWHDGAKRIALETRAAAPERVTFRVEKVPVAWLQGFLAQMWPAGRWTQGTLGGTVALHTPANGPFEVGTDLVADGLALETPDGLIAAAGVGAQMKLSYRDTDAARRIDAHLQLRGGELLAQSFYAVLPGTPVDVEVTAEQSGSAPWRLPNFAWRDPGTLAAQGRADLDADGLPTDLQATADLPNLAIARDRYLSGFLAPAGFPDLLLTGHASTSVQLAAGALVAVDARFDGVNAVDSKARFTFAGVDGQAHWRAHGAADDSRLAWTSGAIYGIGLGPARYDFSSRDGQIKLVAPVALDVLEGKLRLDHFRWQPPTDSVGARFDLGASMDRLDLHSLAQRLGWPPFTGTLDGSIPSAHYQNNVLALDGGLRMALFGGNVQIDDLVWERPFGVAPVLSANVGIQDIDLEPMTSVFGFGSITGRLDGQIKRLRLVDWDPAAFDAWLETDRAWKGKRRISQRAVKDISSVGGSGLIAGVQAKLLGFFSDFGYDRIGIGCALHDNVCRMDGLDSAGNGYIIVAGAGLPRIQVVGFRRQVDWPTLVARLKAATEGQAPVIN